jgi:hypothetical protein
MTFDTTLQESIKAYSLGCYYDSSCIYDSNEDAAASAAASLSTA